MCCHPRVLGLVNASLLVVGFHVTPLTHTLREAFELLKHPDL